MFEFIRNMRLKGLVTNEMLDLYYGVFIKTQEEYDELKAIQINTK